MEYTLSQSLLLSGEGLVFLAGMLCIFVEDEPKSWFAKAVIRCICGLGWVAVCLVFLSLVIAWFG